MGLLKKYIHSKFFLPSTEQFYHCFIRKSFYVGNILMKAVSDLSGLGEGL